MLLPKPDSVDAHALSELYDWPAATWLRCCMVMGLDGSIAGPDGLSDSISSASDRAVFAAVRSLADAYLVGAATVREERYRPVHSKPEFRQSRLARGQLAAPRLAIISGSLDFDWSSASFLGSELRPILVTTASADPEARRAAEVHCDVVTAGEDRVQPLAALAALGELGLTRVTCEGGPGILTQFIRARAIDEADVTLSPTLVGGHSRSLPGESVLQRMRLAQLLEDDGFLFARYLREG